MTCLKDFMLLCWGSFLYTPWDNVFQFSRKKSSWRFLGKGLKLCVLHKNDFLCNIQQCTQSLELFPRSPCEDFFLKIGMLSAKVYTKTVPNIEVCFPRNDLMCISTLHASIASKVIYYQRLWILRKWCNHIAFVISSSLDHIFTMNNFCTKEY